MDIHSIRDFYKAHHLRELGSIAGSLILAVASAVPLVEGRDPHQLAVVSVFAALFALKLAVFLWNRKFEGTPEEEREQKRMALAAGVSLLLMHGTFLIAVLYQLLYQGGTPLMASNTTLAVVYGAYAVTKLVLLVRRAVLRQITNMHAQTIEDIGWVSAVYTLALFTNYLLISQEAYGYTWPRYLMIACMGMTTLVLSTVMIVRAALAMRQHESSPEKFSKNEKFFETHRELVRICK